MKKIVGIMGPSDASETQLTFAYEAGKVVAELGAITLTGGMHGVMAEAMRGAKAGGGETLAICPTFEKSDLNEFVDIPVMTGMRSGRNFINILSSDAVIAIGSYSAGTLSEIAYALQLKRPLLVCDATPELKAYLRGFANVEVSFAEDTNGMRDFLLQTIR